MLISSASLGLEREQIELQSLINILSDTNNDNMSKEDFHISNEAITTTTVENGQTLQRQTRVRRIFKDFQIFFFALTYMSSWEAVAGSIQSSLYNGGPSCLLWGTLLAVCGALAQSASLAEMASMLPIAGAQYHWTALLARSRHARFITWLQGWTTWFAWISLVISSANFTTFIIQGLVTQNNPSYEPKQWHTTLLIWLILLVPSLMNIYTFRIIPWLEVIAGILHIGLFIIFIVVLLALSPSKHSASFVFSTTLQSSGWTSPFISWNLGLIAPVWGFIGFDGAIHLSEEVKTSRLAVPRATFYTIALNGAMAFIMILVLLFTMGPLDPILSSPYPLFTILAASTGSHGATALCSGLFLISLSSNLGGIASVARLTWAWSRDAGLPHYFSHVDARYAVPIRALVLPTAICALLALLNIASTTAFTAFFALASMATYSSYFIAITCMLHARFSAQGVHLGEWNMGRLGAWVNVFALVYSAWIFVFLPWPSFLPVTGVNMNYASPLWGAAVVFSVASWWVWGRKGWAGLNGKVIELVLADS